MLEKGFTLKMCGVSCCLIKISVLLSLCMFWSYFRKLAANFKLFHILGFVPSPRPDKPDNSDCRNKIKFFVLFFVFCTPTPPPPHIQHAIWQLLVLNKCECLSFSLCLSLFLFLCLSGCLSVSVCLSCLSVCLPV